VGAVTSQQNAGTLFHSQKHEEKNKDKITTMSFKICQNYESKMIRWARYVEGRKKNDMQKFVWGTFWKEISWVTRHE
jgi:uncharacterized protein involved in tellurium resistance